MTEADRVKLLGAYQTPRFKYGAVATCAIRGPVKIVGLSNGRIPWPKCRSGKRSRAIILYGALADAVRRESAEAVQYWFGVGQFTVWKWRVALGVERANEGTRKLFSRNTPHTLHSAKARREFAKAIKLPKRGAKIAAALTGRKRPPEVVEKIRRANTGKKRSAASRQRHREALKRRGVIVGRAWTPEENTLLGTMTDKDLAAKLGRNKGAVSAHRLLLGKPAFVKRGPHTPTMNWTPARDRLLGTMSDTDVARRLHCTPMQAFYRRQKLGIPRFGSSARP